MDGPMSRLFDTMTFGSARRRRRMARLLAQLDRPRSSGAVRRRGVPGLRGVATLMVWVLIIGGVVYLARMGTGTKHNASAAASPSAASAQAFGQDAKHSSSDATAAGNGSFPPPGGGEKLTRILPAAPIPAGTGDYKFLQTNGKLPVAYDPCRPIHYVVRDHDTPAGGDQIIQQAVAAVSKATGLEFVNDGMTNELPTAKRAAYQLRYGRRWAPVLIAWTDPKELPALAGAVTGLGGSQSVFLGSQGHRSSAVYVTGAVSLDAPEMIEIASHPSEAGTNLAIVEHELGHLVGLDHVNDPTQIMNPETGAAKSYAAGDLRGLAQLGRGSCHPEL